MATPQLEDKLTCSICLELYQDPVTLPCGHNFCGDCIRDSWRRWKKMCPECRQPFPDGAEPCRNVALSGVLEVLQAAGRRPEPGLESRAGSGARCPRHGRPLELFCRTEGLCVCCACSVRECRHHERALLDVERRERETQLRARLVVTQEQITQAKTQLEELQKQHTQIQSSACNLASVVSSKFTSLIQALQLQQTLALRNIEAAKTQVLTQALDEMHQLQDHLEALAQHYHRVQNLLGQADDENFFQELQQLPESPEPLGPLTPLQWDEDQQLGNLNEYLSPLCNLLLEERNPPRVADVDDSSPVEALGPLTPIPSLMCPLRKKLWENYRNLTFDPESANRHFYLSHQDQQVTHGCHPRGPPGPDSFELWQVQCAQSFQAGRHYWEVHASDHSVTLGVAYPELKRHKLGKQTDNIGRGPCSWGLCIQEDSVQAWHNGKARRLSRVSGRLLGMDLDLVSGRLTFYSLEPQAQALHTFHALFSRPLYPVFWLLEGRTLTLCHQPGSELPTVPQGEASALC
uniref:tripartite motif-containing protein 65 n=1 Tax=Jaculus jaculus TaxID=51337 RepID=UPI001E1B05F7|nr:tripartite motif-containing protein 65 [Jaculus jaculus]